MRRSPRALACMLQRQWFMREMLPINPALCALRSLASLAAWQALHVTRVTLAALLGL